MDRIEAMKLLSEVKHYLTAGNPVWHNEAVAEALDMAIEALQNLSKPNNGLQGSELISIQMAIEHWGRSSGNLTNDQIAELQREIESLPSADLKKMVGCTGCEHYDQQQTAMICRECRRYYKDKHSDFERRMNDGVDSKRTKV